MHRFHFGLSSLLELLYPEHCCGCGCQAGSQPWVAKQPQVPGLRPWDRPHLCRKCFEILLQPEVASRSLHLKDGQTVQVFAAQGTNPLLVDLVGIWKYQGVRGLAWPLGKLLVTAAKAHQVPVRENVVWIPLPLHRRRLRERGFNQAEILAKQLAATIGGRVLVSGLIRKRATGQQAKLLTPEDRAANIMGAFGWGNSEPTFPLNKLGAVFLVDDFVTSGATAEALGNFLQSEGISVDGVLCLGMARLDGKAIPAS